MVSSTMMEAANAATRIGRSPNQPKVVHTVLETLDEPIRDLLLLPALEGEQLSLKGPFRPSEALTRRSSEKHSQFLLGKVGHPLVAETPRPDGEEREFSDDYSDTDDAADLDCRTGHVSESVADAGTPAYISLKRVGGKFDGSNSPGSATSKLLPNEDPSGDVVVSDKSATATASVDQISSLIFQRIRSQQQQKAGAKSEASETAMIRASMQIDTALQRIDEALRSEAFINPDVALSTNLTASDLGSKLRSFRSELQCAAKSISRMKLHLEASDPLRSKLKMLNVYNNARLVVSLLKKIASLWQLVAFLQRGRFLGSERSREPDCSTSGPDLSSLGVEGRLDLFNTTRIAKTLRELDDTLRELETTCSHSLAEEVVPTSFRNAIASPGPPQVISQVDSLPGNTLAKLLPVLQSDIAALSIFREQFVSSTVSQIDEGIRKQDRVSVSASLESLLLYRGPKFLCQQLKPIVQGLLAGCSFDQKMVIEGLAGGSIASAGLGHSISSSTSSIAGAKELGLSGFLLSSSTKNTDQSTQPDLETLVWRSLDKFSKNLQSAMYSVLLLQSVIRSIERRMASESVRTIGLVDRTTVTSSVPSSHDDLRNHAIISGLISSAFAPIEDAIPTEPPGRSPCRGTYPPRISLVQVFWKSATHDFEHTFNRLVSTSAVLKDYLVDQIARLESMFLATTTVVQSAWESQLSFDTYLETEEECNMNNDAGDVHQFSLDEAFQHGRFPSNRTATFAPSIFNSTSLFNPSWEINGQLLYNALKPVSDCFLERCHQAIIGPARLMFPEVPRQSRTQHLRPLPTPSDIHTFVTVVVTELQKLPTTSLLYKTVVAFVDEALLHCASKLKEARNPAGSSILLEGVLAEFQHQMADNVLGINALPRATPAHHWNAKLREVCWRLCRSLMNSFSGSAALAGKQPFTNEASDTARDTEDGLWSEENSGVAVVLQERLLPQFRKLRQSLQFLYSLQETFISPWFQNIHRFLTRSIIAGQIYSQIIALGTEATCSTGTLQGFENLQVAINFLGEEFLSALPTASLLYYGRGLSRELMRWLLATCVLGCCYKDPKREALIPPSPPPPPPTSDPGTDPSRFWPDEQVPPVDVAATLDKCLARLESTMSTCFYINLREELASDWQLLRLCRRLLLMDSAELEAALVAADPSLTEQVPASWQGTELQLDTAPVTFAAGADTVDLVQRLPRQFLLLNWAARVTSEPFDICAALRGGTPDVAIQQLAASLSVTEITVAPAVIAASARRDRRSRRSGTQAAVGAADGSGEACAPKEGPFGSPSAVTRTVRDLVIPKLVQVARQQSKCSLDSASGRRPPVVRLASLQILANMASADVPGYT